MTHTWTWLLLLPLLTACMGGGAIKSAPNQPDWILNPQLAGHISVVGFAPPQAMGGEAGQRRVARMKARQALAQQVRVHVESLFEHRQTDRNGQVSEAYAQSARLSSHVGLRLDRARIHREWVDPSNGQLYIWLVTPE